MLLISFGTSGAVNGLSLDDALAGALKHNLDLKISQEEADRAQDGLEIAAAEFDPIVFFDAGLGQSLSPQNSSNLENTAQPFSETWDSGVSVRKKIGFGTTFNFGTGLDQRKTNSSISAFNPEFNSNFFFGIEQPLLRGAGRKINLAAGRLAKSRDNQARIELLADTLDVLRDTELNYLQLAYENARRALQQSSIEAAEKLLAEIEERERIGVATQVDVLQARAALASKQESIVLADEAIALSRDDLIELIGWRDRADESFVVDPLPTEEVNLPDRRAFMLSAKNFDLNRRSQLEVVRRSQIELEQARDRRRADLRLRFDGSYLGRDTSGFDAYSGAVRRDGYSWRGGLELSLPWGFREAKARERQATRNLRVAELNEEKAEQVLFFELRAVWLDVATGIKRLEVAGVAMELQAEKFEEEEARYEAGLVSLREVLEAQEDADGAELRFLNALVDTLQARVVLQRLDGSLMERHGLSWKE